MDPGIVGNEQSTLLVLCGYRFLIEPSPLEEVDSESFKISSKNRSIEQLIADALVLSNGCQQGYLPNLGSNLLVQGLALSAPAIHRPYVQVEPTFIQIPYLYLSLGFHLVERHELHYVLPSFLYHLIRESLFLYVLYPLEAEFPLFLKGSPC